MVRRLIPQYPKGIFCLLPSIFIAAFFFCVPTASSAESTTKPTPPEGARLLTAPPSGEKAAKTGGSESGPPFITLKVMVVNPSPKFKQVYPLKAYLPEEVKEGHVLDRDGLEVGYDDIKKAYFVTQQLELDPGQSVVKTIRVEDIWFIPEQKLGELSDDAHDLYRRLAETSYAEQGRLLLNNIEVMLIQIMERQNDKVVTPQEHISIYRDNKKKVADIEMDLMSLRRFLTASASGGLFGIRKASDSKFSKLLENMVKGRSEGTVSAHVLWKVIFSILAFLGLATILFLGVLQTQIRNLFSKARKQMIHEPEKKTAPEETKITDFYPGLVEDAPKEGPVQGTPDLKR